jgi:PTS system ascorbate-specific IIA component
VKTTVTNNDLPEELIPKAIRVGASAIDWRDAVRQAGDLLVEAGLVKPGYVTAMVSTMEASGPYFVIAPGLAVPHARPEAGVISAGLGVLLLSKPVCFGSAANDPVDILIPFASGSSDRHVEILSFLATFLSEPGILDKMRRAVYPSDIRKMFGLCSANH